MYGNTQGASSALFRNYPDNSSTFYDASSTSLMAAVTYRLATLTDGRSVAHIPGKTLYSYICLNITDSLF